MKFLEIYLVGNWKDLRKRAKPGTNMRFGHCNFIAIARRGENGF
jgi:hypothetical protein